MKSEDEMRIRMKCNKEHEGLKREFNTYIAFNEDVVELNKC